jgi:hypothetical protein
LVAALAAFAKRWLSYARDAAVDLLNAQIEARRGGLLNRAAEENGEGQEAEALRHGGILAHSKDRLG